jgi:hypothetical protein
METQILVHHCATKLYRMVGMSHACAAQHGSHWHLRCGQCDEELNFLVLFSWWQVISTLALVEWFHR